MWVWVTLVLVSIIAVTFIFLLSRHLVVPQSFTPPPYVHPLLWLPFAGLSHSTHSLPLIRHPYSATLPNPSSPPHPNPYLVTPSSPITPLHYPLTPRRLRPAPVSLGSTPRACSRGRALVESSTPLPSLTMLSKLTRGQRWYTWARTPGRASYPRASPQEAPEMYTVG